MLELILIVLLIFSTSNVFYSYIFLFCALQPPKRQKEKAVGKINHFAIIVPAHNERKVIGYLVENLSRLNYPKEAYRIFVIADNCKDDTEEIAKNRGAAVLSRYDDKQRGKSYAIEWALDQLSLLDYLYDVAIILDADNLVSPNFLSVVNERINEGAEAFQCLVETKNLDNSWIAIGNYITYSAINRIYQTGRDRIGIGAHLCGTGMGFTKRLLDRISWHQNSLTEDREFTYKLTINNIRVVWIDNTTVYDEKPIKLSQSISQQSRWVSGWAMNFKKFLIFFVASFVKKPNLIFADAIFSLIRPLFSISFLLLIPLLIIAKNSLYWIWWGSILFVYTIYYAVGLYLNKSPFKYYLYLLLWPLLKLSSLYAMLKTLLTKRCTSWSHTPHTKGMTIEETIKNEIYGHKGRK